MGKILKTPYLMLRCGSPGCERQAHFTVKDADNRTLLVICDRCALVRMAARAHLRAWQAFINDDKAADFGVAVEGEDLPPGDDKETPQ